MKTLFTILILLSAFSSQGQTIEKPEVCHDAAGYLSCYNDGVDILLFKNGHFLQLESVHKDLAYYEASKTLKLVNTLDQTSLDADTIFFILHNNTLEFRKGKQITIFHSIKEIFSDSNFTPLYDQYYVLDTTGFVVQFGSSTVKVKLWTFDRDWAWDLFFLNGVRNTVIIYTGNKWNRLEFVSIQDSVLKAGMMCSTDFPRYRKISTLRSSYITEWLDNKGRPVVGELGIASPYSFRYDRTGKFRNVNGGIFKQDCQCKSLQGSAQHGLLR
jgi:hypothetical protein